MDFVYFFIRYSPFWAIPIMFICIEFGVRYRMKGQKLIARSLFGIAIFSILVCAFYFWAGGPERSVKYFIKYSEEFFN